MTINPNTPTNPEAAAAEGTSAAAPAPVKLVPGTPEYDAAMIAKGEGRSIETPAAADTPARPEWLPEGFNTPEEFAAAYKALKGETPPADQNADPNASTEGNEGNPDEAAAKAAVEAAGVNYEDLTKEFMETGELSAESRAALTKAGIPDAMVDAYIAGQQAVAERFIADLNETAGGEGALATLTEWAKTGYSAADKRAFNAAMDSSDPAVVKAAVVALRARYEAAEGSEPELNGGRTGRPDATFQSRQEVTKAMSDPRYKSDPAYRRSVEERLARSDVFNGGR